MAHIFNNYLKKDGLKTLSHDVSTKTLSATYEVKDHELDISGIEDLIKRELAHRIIEEAFIQNAVNINKFDKHPYEFSTVYRADLTVVPASHKFTTVRNDAFMVQGEQFNEQEVIEAIKNTYPERLI